ncbi:hypothetical protein [Collinsella tanakaei]|uniref:hypothetical protein n=1 Tax=Collinsella tanakaei TaxID=626935 RepID=UPI0025A44FB0|nr:hypothetical protein [Collinsella tanakaei]MDM8300213.1 hypothetical protein [Collinsella tanakaei]
MIQDLCYHNTKSGGLGFWEPAVSKPGYSRFDEGDLYMFYLVGQLKRAGFTLAEVESSVSDILEDGDALEQTVRAKARMLHDRRAEYDGKLAALECLADAVAAQPTERLFAVMEAALVRSVERAIETAAHVLDVDAKVAARVRMGLDRAVAWLLGVLRGDEDATGCCSECPALVGRIVELVADGAAPTCTAAKQVIWDIAHKVACGQVSDADRDGADDVRGSADVGDAASRFAVCALATFLSEAENGVPIELVFGNGSFAFFAQAARACVADTDGCR